MATSTSLSAPRVNQSLLTNFIGQRITIIGKVISTSAQQVQLEASDGGKFTVIPSPASDYSSAYVEVIGKVLNEHEIQEYMCTKAGENFDMKNYNEFVKLANGRFQELFA